MSSPREYDARQLVSRPFKLLERNRYEQALTLAQIGDEEARDRDDIATQIVLKYLQLTIYQRLRQFDAALACATWVISQTNKVDQLSGELSDTARVFLARSFADWASQAANVSSLKEDDHIPVIEAGEALFADDSMSEFRIEMLHAKSIALGSLGNDKEAVACAEEALARRRLDRGAPGCGLRHHLVVYAESLVRIARRDEALAAITEAVDLFPRDEETWSTRGDIRFSQNELEGAFQDYRESLFIRSRPAVLVRKALVGALLGLGNTVDDLRAAQKEMANNPEAILWGRLLSAGAPGIVELSQEDSIDGACARYCLRKINGEMLIAAVNELGGTSRKRALNKCQVYCVLGADNERGNDGCITSIARTYYNESITAGTLESIYYAWANSRIAKDSGCC